VPWKTTITIVGPGRVGSALGPALKRAGYQISEVVSRESSASQRAARSLARATGAEAVTARVAELQAKVIWFLVPDREIGAAARELASKVSWKGKIAFHSSGALGSEELEVLRQLGAAVASVHPFMTFVNQSAPSLEGVPFGIEGDSTAVRMARGIVGNMGAAPFTLTPAQKVLYHAWGGFTSPLVVSLLVTAEKVAEGIGFSTKDARKWAAPIVQQTIANYAQWGAAEAFSGPIVRGDAAVVRKHVEALKENPEALAVYVALARSALRNLPAKNRKELEKVLEGGRRRVAPAPTRADR
jgi:predicted short-subunit dehydrogenase-like oxidoreductase (DUF2520 family)